MESAMLVIFVGAFAIFKDEFSSGRFEYLIELIATLDPRLKEKQEKNVQKKKIAFVTRHKNGVIIDSYNCSFDSDFQ